jgi:hypothetical protein
MGANQKPSIAKGMKGLKSELLLMLATRRGMLK